MEQKKNIKNVDHLVNLILTRNDDVANFALLLGSGASSNSGVRTAREMIDLWRMQVYERSETKKDFERWLREQSWYESDDEYSLLFELVGDEPSQRRVYIEECVRPAHPSWGYVYLTNLLKHNFFNVVFTTNFDDLVNEACFLYSEGLHPIVCAHDSAVSGIRVTSKRPKIIKLHGDFLYDNIKNTVRELETLEGNMKRKFMQFAQEYGLVVVGYSGRDRSVMDILEMLVRSEEYFKHGVYWCIKEGDTIGRRLQSLLRKDRVYPVEIPGFDEFMAYIHHEAGLSLPAPIANPIRVARDRARLFINVHDSLKADKLVSKDIEEVLKGLQEVMPVPELASSLPSSLIGAVLKESGDLEGALHYWKEALEDDPSDTGVMFEVADILARLPRRDELKEFVIQSEMENANKAYFLLHANDNDGALSIPIDHTRRIDRGGMYTRINHAIALKRLGRFEEMENEISIISKQRPKEDVQAGIAALRKNKHEMIRLLDVALDKRLITVDNVRMFVVFEDYWEDSDLLKLLAVREQLETGEEDT